MDFALAEPFAKRDCKREHAIDAKTIQGRSMLFSLRRAAALTMALLLSACVSLAPERGYQETRALIGEQRAMPPQWPNDEQPATPAMIDLEGALRLAFFSSPKVRASYARIGIGRAEFEDARRLPNPSFGYLRLRPNDGEGS
jgi:hypothetical protein